MTLTNIAEKIDKWQRNNRPAGFVLGVIKKYNDDQAGYLAVLLTYYGFLAIFPLMLVITTVVKQVLPLDSQLRSKIITNLTAHVPIIGNQLNSSVHGLHHSGPALALALLLTFYGIRGIANATQFSLNHIWLIPKDKRPHFPQNTMKSLLIVLTVGIGFLATAILSSYITSLGHSLPTSIASVLISFVVVALALGATFIIGTAKRQTVKRVFYVALTAAIGLEILQLIGGYIVVNELKHLTSLYGLFAAVLGLVFWLYLQSTVVLYAVEASSVSQMKLWPRGLNSSEPTAQDHLANQNYKRLSGL